LPTDIHDRVSRQLLSGLSRLGTGSPVQLMSSIDSEQGYLRYGTMQSQHLFDGNAVPSQLVRKLVSAELAQSWDWRRFDRWEAFDETLALLRATDVAA